MILGLIALCLVVGGAVAAYIDKAFWPSKNDGLSWAGHWGMWCDLLLIVPSIWWMDTHDAVVPFAFPITFLMFVGTLAISVAMHYRWAVTAPEYEKWRGVHVRYPDTITYSGWFHVVFMTQAITCFTCFFINADTSLTSKLSIAIAVVLTVVIGTVQPALYFRES